MVANLIYNSQHLTIEGLPIWKAIYKTQGKEPRNKKQQREVVHKFIKDVVLNFEEDATNIIVKILPVLLQMPIDLYAVRDWEEDDEEKDPRQ